VEIRVLDRVVYESVTQESTEIVQIPESFGIVRVGWERVRSVDVIHDDKRRVVYMFVAVVDGRDSYKVEFREIILGLPEICDFVGEVTLVQNVVDVGDKGFYEMEKGVLGPHPAGVGEKRFHDLTPSLEFGENILSFEFYNDGVAVCVHSLEHERDHSAIDDVAVDRVGIQFFDCAKRFVIYFGFGETRIGRVVHQLCMELRGQTGVLGMCQRLENLGEQDVFVAQQLEDG
jgi:hypothetical protein